MSPQQQIRAPVVTHRHPPTLATAWREGPARQTLIPLNLSLERTLRQDVAVLLQAQRLLAP